MNMAALARLRDEVSIRPFDSGGTSPRYVVAAYGRHFVVTPAIAAILEETRNLPTNGNAFEALAQRASARAGVRITPEQVELLIRERIPKALFDPATGLNTDESPLLFRRLLFNGNRLKPILSWVAVLFSPIVAIVACSLAASISAIAAFTVPGRSVEMTGSDCWLSFLLTLIGIFIHELGHLAACHRFGGQHGGIGVGIYWCLPAFYAEVHGAWTLPRRQRAAVDIGGVYLQLLFCGVLGSLYLLSAAPALLSAMALSLLLMLHTLNPVLKFDGYWLLADLAGIHNLHRRIRDIARRVLTRRRVERNECVVLASFVVIALAYFSYLLTLLGRNLGRATASFFDAALTIGFSSSSLLTALGKGLLLAFMSAMAGGVALALARSAAAIFTESPNER
jgi:putative peptide zinc metalloprotease protein